jgi:hypothetical protein
VIDTLGYTFIMLDIADFISLHFIFHSFIHSSMALQTFVRPWTLLQFRNSFSHRR